MGLKKKIGEQLKSLKVNAEYESFKIPYVVPSVTRSYTPDYLLPNGIVLELKGLFVLEDRKKHLFIKEQYPSLDIRFVFSNSKTKLRKGLNPLTQNGVKSTILFMQIRKFLCPGYKKNQNLDHST